MKKLTLILATLLLLLTGCKKLRSKDTLVIDITVENPIEHTPFPGVIYKIYEVKDQFSIGLSSNQKKELIYTGTTDANGKAFYEFDAIKNAKFSYEITFDYSDMDVPDGEYYLNKTRDFDYLKKNEDNVYYFDILPYGESYTHIKNVNCVNVNDHMKYRVKFIDIGTGNWGDWTHFNDCYEYIGASSSKPSERIIYEMQVTKNNVTTAIIDTFYREPNTLFFLNFGSI